MNEDNTADLENTDLSTGTEEVAATESTPEVRRSVGRPRDTTGTTALGKARLIFESDTSQTPKQLKARFVAEIGCKPQVAQAYASLVRKSK